MRASQVRLRVAASPPLGTRPQQRQRPPHGERALAPPVGRFDANQIQREGVLMNRILTTHAGSLIRPPEVVALLNAVAAGEAVDEAVYGETLRKAVSGIVKQQLEVGLDVIDDGEIGKVAWTPSLYERVSGLELRNIEHEGSMLPPSRDRQHFPGAYARP